MGNYDRFLERILRGASDANIFFSQMCQLLKKLGFEERIWGSYHIFVKERLKRS